MSLSGKQIVLLVQGAVTVTLLTVVFQRVDAAALRAALTGLPLWLIGLSFLTVLFGHILYAYRWHVLMRALGMEPDITIVVQQHFVGTFMSNFLPSTVGGDVAKVYYVGRDRGYVAATASVMLDRLLGFGILTGVSLLLLRVTQAAEGPLALVGNVLAVVFGAFVLGILILAMASRKRRAASVLRRNHILAEAGRQFGQLIDHVRDGLQHPSAVATASAIVVAYVLMIAFVYYLYLSNGGHDVSYLSLAGTVGAIAALSNIPISLGGLGLREQLHVALLAPLGIHSEEAIAISLVLFGHMLLISALGGVLWLRSGASGGSGTTRRQV